MHLVQTNVKEEGGSNPTMRVEFCGADGEVISVVLNHAAGASREDAIVQARKLMVDVAAAVPAGDSEVHDQQTRGAVAR